MAIWLFGACAILSGVAAHADSAHVPWRTKCKPHNINDGDSFTCLSSERGRFRVRFAGVDAPESGQAFSRQSQKRFAELLSSSTLIVECYKLDQYDREVCRIYVNGIDVAPPILEAGLAWHSVRYKQEQRPEERERYASAEASARGQRLGLWKQSDPMPPWECRSRKRQGLSCR